MRMIYRKWINKNGISGKEFLIHAVECGWINAGFIESEQKYFMADEMYALLIEAIKRKLAYDSEFEKLIFKQLILEEKISGKDLCRLLYDQEVLANADEDYEKLVSGKMDVFSFLKKKIEQLKITPAQLLPKLNRHWIPVQLRQQLCSRKAEKYWRLCPIRGMITTVWQIKWILPITTGC